MNSSSVTSLLPVPDSFATPFFFFFILFLLTQSSMRTFLATLQRNASTSVILIFAPCFIFLNSLTYCLCHPHVCA